MYKVFYNRQTIIFSPDSDNIPTGSGNIIITQSDSNRFNFQLNNFMDPESNSVIIVAGSNYESCKRNFLSDYYPVYAAGGVVMGPEGRILVIKRRGIWDLPKGKQDKHESPEGCAIRETTEETGIGMLSIISEPFITNHIYLLGDKWHIKHTSWFLMKTPGAGNPVPQICEDITNVMWGDKRFLASEVMQNTYPLIRDILRHYLPGLK